MLSQDMKPVLALAEAADKPLSDSGMEMGPAVEPEDFEDIIKAAEALLSESESPPEPKGPSLDIETPAIREEIELKIESAADAQTAVRQQLRDEYGDKMEVAISKTVLESNKSDGSKLWVVEGDAEVKMRLFRKKKWHFTYFLDPAEGKIRIVRSSRM